MPKHFSDHYGTGIHSEGAERPGLVMGNVKDHHASAEDEKATTA